MANRQGEVDLPFALFDNPQLTLWLGFGLAEGKALYPLGGKMGGSQDLFECCVEDGNPLPLSEVETEQPLGQPACDTGNFNR